MNIDEKLKEMGLLYLKQPIQLDHMLQLKSLVIYFIYQVKYQLMLMVN